LDVHVACARRDFSNGFLAAEIYSRYYDGDIHMHSFDNGTSLTTKRNNWRLLQRILAKRGVTPGGAALSDAEVELLIASNAEAVAAFLKRTYEFLSGRRLQSAVRPPPDAFMPSYARPTASLTIARRLQDPSVRSEGDARFQASVVRVMIARGELGGGQGREGGGQEGGDCEARRFVGDVVGRSR
jgi:hypothetical protein